MGKVATVTITAALLSGCSSAVERFGENPYYTANTQNQREIFGGNAPAQPSYQDIVSGPAGTSAGLPQNSAPPVTTASIPQTTRTVQAAPLPAPATTLPAQASLPTPAVATAPAPETVAAGPAKSWKGWTSAGGTKVQVRRGDTLNSVARRYGVPIQALAAVNGIQDPSNVRAGQTVVIPTYVYSENNGTTSATEGELAKVKLPVASTNEQVVTGSIPTVARTNPRPDRKPYAQPTFAQITNNEVKAQPVPVLQVSTAPKRKPGDVSKPLTTASIPKTALPSSSVPTPRPQPGKPPALTAAPSGTVETTKLPAPALTTEAAPTAPIKTPQVVASVQPEAENTTSQFRWPVRGRIISDFGAKPGGGRNEGVNLAVPEGTQVKAADGGTVIYSGNELKGYGNLILVRHEGGWVSAYAHNSELKVKRGDKVRRGDTVALAGATGSVTQPQLHFELRKGNKPVDPLKYMPRR